MGILRLAPRAVSPWGGPAVWLILREREVRLNKLCAGADMRYSNGIAVLEISGNQAKLTDGTAVFADRKTPAAAPPK